MKYRWLFIYEQGSDHDPRVLNVIGTTLQDATRNFWTGIATEGLYVDCILSAERKEVLL